MASGTSVWTKLLRGMFASNRDQGTLNGESYVTGDGNMEERMCCDVRRSQNRGHVRIPGLLEVK
jgi:hypothetical protein